MFIDFFKPVDKKKKSQIIIHLTANRFLSQKMNLLSGGYIFVLVKIHKKILTE